MSTTVDTPRIAEAPSTAAAHVTVGVAENWSALAVLMAGTFVIVLDFFIVNVALPSIQSELHATATTIEWVVVGYGLTFAACLIMGGQLGDRIGRRRTFSLGLGLFTIASAACGAAPDATILVAARLVQGVAGALISPNVLAIIGVLYTGPARIRALTTYGMVMGFAALGAQLIGGLLMQADIAGLGWRTVFLINLPIGIAGLLLAGQHITESRAESGVSIDVHGTILITAGLTTLLLGLVEGPQHSWPEWTLLSLAAAPILLAVFVAYQARVARRGGSPVLDPAMFRDRAFTGGLITQLVFWCGQASFFLVLALYLQNGRGLSPLAAGGVFTILAAAYLVTSRQAPKLALRYGRDVIAFGALTLALGDALLMMSVADVGTGGPILALVPGLVLVGAGMGLCITPLVSIVLMSVDPRRAGAASGTLSTVQQLGNSLGVALTGMLFFGTLQSGYAQAFELSLLELAALLLAVAALTRLLPRRV